MNPSFTTTEAQDFWDAIPPHFQQRVLNNVWCPHEGEMTTIADDFWVGCQVSHWFYMARV